jgi:hypothetical protein
MRITILFPPFTLCISGVPRLIVEKDTSRECRKYFAGLGLGLGVRVRVRVRFLLLFYFYLLRIFRALNMRRR